MKLNFGKRFLMFLHWLCSLLIAAALVLLVIKPPFAVEYYNKFTSLVTPMQLKIIAIGVLVIYAILVIAELCLVFKRRKRIERGFIVMDSSDSGGARIAISAIEQMVRRSVTNIEGITDMKIKIESEDDAINIRVNASLINGGHVPTVTMNMQQAIRQFVEMNCGVAVRSVPIVIRSVSEPSRRQKKKNAQLAAPAQPEAEKEDETVVAAAEPASEPETVAEPAPVEPVVEPAVEETPAYEAPVTDEPVEIVPETEPVFEPVEPEATEPEEAYMPDEPEEIYEPVEDTAPAAEVYETAEAAEPEDIYAPEEAAETAETYAPVEEAEPEDIYAPAETAESEETYAPAEEAEPEDVFAPVETVEAEDVYAPEESYEPAEATEPEEAAEPEDAGEAEEADEPRYTYGHRDIDSILFGTGKEEAKPAEDTPEAETEAEPAPAPVAEAPAVAEPVAADDAAVAVDDDDEDYFSVDDD